MDLHSSSVTRKMVCAVLAGALCLTPEMLAQQPPGAQPPTAQPSQQSQQPQTAQPSQQPQPSQPATQPSPAGQPQQQPSGTTVNPSQPPLQPPPVTTYPGPQPEQQPAQTTTVPEAPQPKQQPRQPLGAATAEKVPTAGGAASKPAGAAIAPAQQHQTRSLLIKLGAIAAAGVAIGTVVALSKGSPSKPPGAP